VIRWRVDERPRCCSRAFSQTHWVVMNMSQGIGYRQILGAKVAYLARAQASTLSPNYLNSISARTMLRLRQQGSLSGYTPDYQPKFLLRAAAG
jgi:hypothetical protein